MKLEYSPALQIAFDRAKRFAAQDSSLQVTARHLLRGLLAEEEGNAAWILKQSGLDWDRLQAHLGPPEVDVSNGTYDAPLHPALQVVIRQAGDLAIRHGQEGSIATDHVLLALLSVNESLRDELAGFGLDFERLRTTVARETAALTIEDPLLLHEPVEETNVARILDANANRAREALRVLEDYARFTLEDAFLSAQLKELRHAFAQAVQMLPTPLLLESRDTTRDVGTAISTAQEWHRPSLQSVVQANAKRLQEALRTLEEYGKVLSTEFARRMESLRYRCYVLERPLTLSLEIQERLTTARLCVLVTDSACRASLVGTVREAILGGAGMIQLREKDIDDRTLLARARDVRQITQSAGALFIVNDRPDIARLAEADGVHLGQDDLPVRDARSILGPDALIGVSTHDIDQVRRAVLDGANYLGVGPTFASKTKVFTDFAGLNFVRQACAETTIPAFAIGGIGIDNVAEVRAAGARRIAVSNAICAAEDPRAAARALCQSLHAS